MKDENKKLKAVIYCRTSGKNQSLETDFELKKLEKSDKSGKISLQYQEQECRKLAEKYDYDVVEVFRDNDYSCITYPDTEYFRERAKGDKTYQKAIKDIKKITEKKSFRPELGRMIQVIEKEKINVVIVREETRLMRPLPKSGLMGDFLSVLEECNTIIRTTKGNYIDPKNFQDIFILQIVSMTEIQSMMNKIEASKASIIQKRDNGDVYGKLYCFGYEQDDCNLIPVEKELKIVKEIFRQCLDGVPLCLIARYLNKNQIPTYNGGKMWRDNNVRNILKRPTYAGLQKKSDFIEFVPINVLKLNKPPITFGEYLRVQDILKTHTKKSRATKHCHPLSGLIKCGDCGSPMTISTSTNIRTKSYKFIYRCHLKRDGYLQDKQYKCDTNITAYRDSDLLMFKFDTFKPNGLFECIQPLLAIEYLKNINLSEKEILDEILVLQHKITLIDNAEKELLSRVTNGTMTMDKFSSLFDESQAKRNLLKDKVNSLQKNMALHQDNIDLKIEYGRRAILSQGFLKRDYAKQIIHKVIERINVFKTKIEVKFIGIDRALTIPRMVYYRAFTLPFGRLKVGRFSKEVYVYYYLKSYYRKREESRTPVWRGGGLSVYFMGKPY